MILSHVDINTINRLYLAYNSPATPTNSQPANVKPLEPHTEADAAFTQLVSVNPLIAELQQRLNLVSTTTGRPAKLLTDEQLQTFHSQKQSGLVEQLQPIALKAFEAGRIYTKAEAIASIQQQTNVNEQRAVKGLELMLQYKLLAAA